MLRFPSAIVLLLVFGGVSAPRTAMASCGDWLAHPQTVVDDGKVETARVGEAQVSTHSPAMPRTCNGPLCKQSPQGPIPSPTAPTTEPFHQQLACTLRQSRNDSLLQAGFIAEPDLYLPSGNPLSIDRPPQS